VEGALQATHGRPHSPDEIESVRVRTTVLSATLDAMGAAAIDRSPLDANAVNFSVRLSVAAALVFGDLTPAQLHPDRLIEAEAAIRALASKVRVEHDWAQTLRMFGSSPLGLQMLMGLRSGEVVRLVLHARRLNRSSGRVGRNPGRLRGLPGAAVELFPALMRARRVEHISSLGFDPLSFRMLQSAHTEVTTRSDSSSAVVNIPQGACGRDGARDLVRWRCEHVFGDRASGFWRTLFDERATIAELCDTVHPGR